LGFQTLNNQRFGARFVGDVANPGDILLFHQRRRTSDDSDRNRANGTSRSRGSGANNPLALPVAPDIDDLKVEDLIADHLHSSDKKLRLLKEADLKDALDVRCVRLFSSLLVFI
jgi:double-strand break repair protein MRE11